MHHMHQIAAKEDITCADKHNRSVLKLFDHINSPPSFQNKGFLKVLNIFKKVLLSKMKFFKFVKKYIGLFYKSSD